MITKAGFSYCVATLTGRNACNLGGITLHKLLGLWDIKKPIKSLIHMPYSKPTAKHIKNIDFLLIDEASLIGAYFLNLLNHRLQFIRNSKQPYGNINILFSEDSFQLSCVKDIPLTKNPVTVQDPFARESLLLFQNPDFRFELTDQVRQKDDKQFEQLLKNVRNKCMTEDDKKLLISRHENNVSRDELNSFLLAPVVFATNEQIDNFNEQSILSKNIPVKKINPVFSSYCAVCAKQYKSFYVGSQLKMVIVRNLAYELGIANGCEVTCIDALFDGFDKRPSIIIVYCDRFRGTPLRNTKGHIPIGTYTETFYCPHQKINVTVNHFPIVNNEACSFYRLQGSTLSKLVICLDGINKYSRELYVGISRVQTSSGLLFKSKKPIDTFFI